MVIFVSGPFLSGKIFSVQESGIFVFYFVYALSWGFFVGFPLGEVGLKLKAKGLILFEAVLSLNLFFKRNAE